MPKEMILKESVKNRLANEMYDVLEYYNLHPSMHACLRIIETWFENKKEVMAPFASHENWIEDKFMLVYKADYEREINRDDMYSFYHWIESYYDTLFPKKYIYYLGNYRLSEMDRMVSSLKRKIELLRKPEVYSLTTGETKKDTKEMVMRLDQMLSALREHDNKDYVRENETAFSHLDKFMGKFGNFINKEEFTSVIDNYLADIFNYVGEKTGINISAREGQRITKPLLKLLRGLGYEQIREGAVINGIEMPSYTTSFNKMWAKFGDAINPLKYQRYTILSFNPIDYLRMSLGNSWTSCHTIDKANIDDRDSNTNYFGMHANGTISYMLDGSSAVFYTLEPSYNGTDYELEDKVTRQMFHFGTAENPLFIAGRLYPQSNDSGSYNTYKQVRECVQNIVAQVWGLDNNWKTESMKGNSNYVDNYSSGAHYPDFFNFSNICKISKNKTNDINVYARIPIGHEGICVTCGGINNEDGELSCCEPFAQPYTCAKCGYETDYEDDLHYIDGSYYCEECCFYCEYHYHGRWETGPEDSIYINNYGRICQDAYNEEFDRCESCGEDFHISDGTIKTEDGYRYCCSSCAERDGYVCIDGDWVSEDSTCTCHECGDLGLTDDMYEINGHMYCFLLERIR